MSALMLSDRRLCRDLLGAMVGGVLEYSALVVGYRSLLLGAALLYILAGMALQSSRLEGPRKGP